MPRKIWRMLLAHCARRALSFAAFNAGKSNAARIEMIATTTRSSMRVKAGRAWKVGRKEEWKDETLPAGPHSGFAIIPLFQFSTLPCLSSPPPEQQPAQRQQPQRARLGDNVVGQRDVAKDLETVERFFLACVAKRIEDE